ncbi:MAG: cbb3-type cytochrome oxidase assembly protein CcoS [Saprospiraceae bacterium]|nr:cbb3-type cytochrome oxidase assembly protein CcoS [Saprospiraceae bacterium]
MKIIIWLIIASFCLALIFLAAFFWAVKSGQYEDDYSPSVRILQDDKAPGLNDADSGEEE